MMSSPPYPHSSLTHQDAFEPVLYGLRRRQRAVLAIAALLAIAAGLVMVTAAIAPTPPSQHAGDTQHIGQLLALGLVLAGVGVAAIALTRLNPRNARVYLLLKHKPEAIANIFFDVKHVRGYAYEYMVIQTDTPRQNYVVPGIQRFGIPQTLTALQRLCPKARFSCSPVVKQRYFANDDSTTS